MSRLNRVWTYLSLMFPPAVMIPGSLIGFLSLHFGLQALAEPSIVEGELAVTWRMLVGVLSLGQNLTAVPYPKEDAVLVESGVFRIVRHPIYSGIILGSLGWGLLTNSLLALFLTLVLFIFFDIKSRREEQWLSDKYADYPAYQARVRKLIPLIY